MKIRTIAYKGGAAALLDAANGEISMAIGWSSELEPFTSAGRLITVAAAWRLAASRSTPTCRRSPRPASRRSEFLGVQRFLRAPAGTPAEVVDRLNAEILKAAQRSDMKEWMDTNGGIYMPLKAADFTTFFRKEQTKWKRMSEEDRHTGSNDDGATLTHDAASVAAHGAGAVTARGAAPEAAPVMKALVSRTVGGPETLVIEELPDPRPGNGELLASVHAIGVDFPDGLFIRDQYQVRIPRPFSPGAEFCGTVEAVGEGVTGFSPGDRIIGRCGWGAMAQRIALPAARCAQVPADAPVDEAAALQFTYATACHALHDAAAIRPGETLLVPSAPPVARVPQRSSWVVQPGPACWPRCPVPGNWRSPGSGAPTTASSTR